LAAIAVIAGLCVTSAQPAQAVASALNPNLDYNQWSAGQYGYCEDVDNPISLNVTDADVVAGFVNEPKGSTYPGSTNMFTPGVCYEFYPVTITNTTNSPITVTYNHMQKTGNIAPALFGGIGGWLGGEHIPDPGYPAGFPNYYLTTPAPNWNLNNPWPGAIRLEPGQTTDEYAAWIGMPQDVDGQGYLSGSFTWIWDVDPAPEITPPIPGTGPASLTIIKYEKPDTKTGLPNKGTALTDEQIATLNAATSPMKNVQFCYQQVTSDGTNDIDLTTNAGWLVAANLASNWPLSAQVLFSPPTITEDNSSTYCQTTGDNGQADFSGLPYGLYYVTERTVPFGVAAALPFLVTLPMTNADGTARSDHVYAYPKDDIDAVAKDITSVSTGKPGEKVGDLIEYTVTAKVPELSATDNFTNYVFTDIFDVLLDYAAAPVPVVRIGDTDLTIGTDYAVDNSVTKTLTISLTGNGLTALTAAARSDVPVTISFVFNARANNQGANISNGGLGNGTKVDYSVNGKPIPVVESSETEVKYGGMSIWKYGYDKVAGAAADITEIETGLMANANGTQLGDAALAGAQFRLFLSEADALAYASDSSTVAPVAFHTAPKPADGSLYVAEVGNIDYVGWVDIVETDSQGHAMFGGLAYGEYCALEVTAPAAYSLLTSPVCFEITEPLDGQFFGLIGQIDEDDDMLVANVPANAGFPIPMTGGAGVVTYLLIATTIAGLTALVVRKQRRTANV